MGGELYYHSFLNRDRLVHIVDGDVPTCEALSVLFRLEGFQTVFSVDTAGFYAGLERRRPDVVVLNMRIGSEDGVAVLRRIKALRTGMAVFMLSNEGQVDVAVKAMKAGAADVITKPIDTEHFIRAVLEALRQDVHLGAIDGGRRPIEVRGFSHLPPREREVLPLIPTASPTRRRGGNSASRHAPSKCIAPG